MLRRPNLNALLIVVASSLVVAACGGSSGSADTQGTTTTATEEEHADDFHFGEPAEAAEADRVIEIAANDDFSFDPSEITVTVGEVVTFRITNTGVVPHDFTLGDQETQEEHEAEMMEMMESGSMVMHDEVNAVALAAGETKEITWRFTDAGTFLIGCHQAGHYAAGMKGSVVVDS
ncbi:MAG: plastocyanin/azurin family copper-binding protein [Acidimicrobiia bacterium]|nr:plastocyanin/azurin family copper-binding protein [Acidimicrobiia bacterium]MDH3463987.1 plastocyanin/azurin family copper-binding protein [Acidimicrobiia bacterium]